jgi:hypothetical protein
MFYLNFTLILISFNKLSLNILILGTVYQEISYHYITTETSLCKKLSSVLFIIRRKRNITDDKTAIIRCLRHTSNKEAVSRGAQHRSKTTIEYRRSRKKVIRTILRKNNTNHCKTSLCPKQHSHNNSHIHPQIHNPNIKLRT